jgi:hypothetical protein
MADQNPTAGPRVVPVKLLVSQTEILRSELNGWLAGIEEDLEAGLRSPDREAAIKEADAFGVCWSRSIAARSRCPMKRRDRHWSERQKATTRRAATNVSFAVHDAHHALLSVLG